MANDFTLGVGQAHELEMAMNRAGGWNRALVKALSTGSNLADIRDVLLKRFEIKPIEYLINCDVAPFCPSNWKVEEHKKGGKIRWTRELFQLYLSKKQKGSAMKGKELRKELKSKPTLNANVLDFLLKNLHLIPEEWKNESVFFWGTIYRDSDSGNLYVRFLRWDGRWFWDGHWLGYDWHGDDPAVVLASIK